VIPCAIAEEIQQTLVRKKSLCVKGGGLRKIDLANKAEQKPGIGIAEPVCPWGKVGLSSEFGATDVRDPRGGKVRQEADPVPKEGKGSIKIPL
jgi:hypothetical protein